MESEMTVGEMLNSIYESKKEIERMEKARINRAKAKTRRETKPREIQAKNLKPYHHIIVENLEDLETDRWTGMVTGSSWTDFRENGEKGKLEVGCINTKFIECETMAYSTFWVVDASDQDWEDYKANNR